MYVATGGPNVKWGGHRFQMGGPGTTDPPMATALAARLNYSSPSTTAALENVYLLTPRQESELMFRNNGLLHHNAIIAAVLLS